MNPDGWTDQDEADYQATLVKLKAQIDVAGPSDDIGIMRAEYPMMANPDFGRLVYLKCKRNGWL